MKTLKLWRPDSTLPWRALKKGTDDYIWYEIVDRGGWEVCGFGAVSTGLEHDELFRQMALLLMSVNKSPVINVNGEDIKIEWLGLDAVSQF